MRGGGLRPFGTFPKIRPFWLGHPSLTEDFTNEEDEEDDDEDGDGKVSCDKTYLVVEVIFW